MTAGPLLTAVAFLAAYVGLDWLSFFHAWGAVGITPWNPSPALGLVLLMRRGLTWAPLLFVAQLAAELLVRGLPAPWPATLCVAVAVALVYTAAAAALRARPFGARVPDVLRLFAVAGSAAAAAGLASVAVFAVAGLVPVHEFGHAALRYWIGDVIGSVVVVPLALALPRLLDRPAGWGEAALQGVAALLALWIVFGIESTDEFQFFYLLFLPLVWVAVRRGLPGAALAVALVQLGLVLAFELIGHPAGKVTALQFLMLALAATTLVLGAAVEERLAALARLSAILATAPDGILTIDSEGRVEIANPAAERMFGGPLAGRDPASLGLGGGPEIEACRLDGAHFPAEVASGGDVLVLRDVSRRRQVETRLREQQAQLAHAGRRAAAGEMGSALAHELNQPLAAIIAFSRAARRLASAGEGLRLAETLDKVVAQADRAGEIIRRLREFLRRGEGTREPVAPALLLDEAVALVAGEAAPRGIRLAVEVAPDLPAVLADRIQIEQVLTNLLRNAFDALAASEGARLVTLSARLAGEGRVELAVHDSGPGVDPAMAEALFTPFASGKEHGMGLGLAISRGIVESHGGRLCYDGRDGASFRFDLPAAVDQIEETAASA